MSRVDQATYARRKERVFLTLRRYPLGLTEAEIMQITGIQRRTLNNYLRALETEAKIYKDGISWVALPYDQVQLRKFDLSPEEAMTLYLATRLLVKQHDKRNEPAETALMKLATVLTADAGVGREIHQAALELSQRPGDERYSRIFRTIMQSYIYRRKVDITYRPLNGSPFPTRLAPYLLEPSAIGYATYVIGHSSLVNDLRTYKLERIEQAALTAEEYHAPAGFPGLDILRNAWSIIHGDEVQTVRLRFHPRVARRVRESRWHPSQEIVDDPDHPGGCLWTAEIADLTDFLPWARSWGADVEVLEPELLRERMKREAWRLAALYQAGDLAPPPLYQKLWAKANRRTGECHPLICHMIDVAQVTLALWRAVLTPGIRAQLAGALGLEEDAAGRVIAFWSGLHDLGKATPAFQRKWPPAQAELSQAGLAFPAVFAQETFSHGAASTCLLTGLLESETDLPRRLAQGVARSTGGHHGAWPVPSHVQSFTPIQLGGEDWDAVRRDLVHVLLECLEPPDVGRIPESYPERNALWTLLSGLTSVADWIGSTEDYFPYADTPVSLKRYLAQSAGQAGHALDALNWTGWTPPGKPRSFTQLFQVPTVRPMQAQVVELAGRLNQPALVIIEAPTGTGKTEAALYLADHWARTLQQRGLYVAMPTLATSNQMFGRVGAMLAHRYPDGAATPLLVHSQAAWTQETPPPALNVGDEESAHGEGTTEAMTWFLPRKRSLLAPFGVGTVDQALMSVLQTRHFFVRMLGLSHKTVIFDEVHAYDTYMSALFQRLLAWLRAIGASVVILSATLPAKTRRELLEAYAGTAGDSPRAEYPAITWAMEGHIGVVPLAEPDPRTLALDWIGPAPEVIAARLDNELRDGGCAAVICNTVKRAQEVYRAVQAARIVPPGDLILFHARFPRGRRNAIEADVLGRFGKNAPRPAKAIVIATQVIEQSLDLDFDLMISDLAPIDLLLQRAGRLHRHKRDARPALLRAPRLLIVAPRLENGLPVLEAGDRAVYESYVLLRTYMALRGRSSLTAPDDTSAVIEAVYGETEGADGPLATLLAEARQKMEKHAADDVYQARLKLVASPEADNLLVKSNLGLAEDSPDVHQAFQALTRLGPPSITLVCLHRVDDTLNTEPDGSGQTIDLDRAPDAARTQALVQASVAVSARDAVNHFRAGEPPRGWRDHPLLSHWRVAIFENGSCPLAGSNHTLRLTRDLGLEVV